MLLRISKDDTTLVSAQEALDECFIHGATIDFTAPDTVKKYYHPLYSSIVSDAVWECLPDVSFVLRSPLVLYNSKGKVLVTNEIIS